ncbi:MAG: hypothetical protein GY755_22150 [Chloroflexi bacterium]|nr:hypothetical protein [Chloroflexota bacterium]
MHQHHNQFKVCCLIFILYNYKHTQYIAPVSELKEDPTQTPPSQTQSQNKNKNKNKNNNKNIDENYFVVDEKMIKEHMDDYFWLQGFGGYLEPNFGDIFEYNGNTMICVSMADVGM